MSFIGLLAPAAGYARLGFLDCVQGFHVSFLRPLEGLFGMFQRLPGLLVPSEVIFFSVGYGGRAVRVRGKFMELGGSLVRIKRHAVKLPETAI